MAWNNEQILVALTKRLTEQLNIDADQVKLDATWDDLGADSLDTVELVMWCEDKFNVQIPDQEAEQCCTVGDVVRLLARKS